MIEKKSSLYKAECYSLQCTNDQDLKFHLFICFHFLFGAGYKDVSLGTVDEVDEKAKRHLLYLISICHTEMCTGCSSYWCYPFLVVA